MSTRREAIEQGAEVMRHTPDAGDWQTTLVDLLTNLMHWAQHNGVSFDDALYSAQYTHYPIESATPLDEEAGI